MNSTTSSAINCVSCAVQCWCFFTSVKHPCFIQTFSLSRHFCRYNVSDVLFRYFSTQCMLGLFQKLSSGGGQHFFYSSIPRTCGKAQTPTPRINRNTSCPHYTWISSSLGINLTLLCIHPPDKKKPIATHCPEDNLWNSPDVILLDWFGEMED